MPNLDFILPFIPRDNRVGLARDYAKVTKIEKNRRLKEFDEEEQNQLPQQPSKQPEKQPESPAEPVAEDERGEGKDADDDYPHLDTYA